MAVPIDLRKLTNSSLDGTEKAPRKRSIPPQPAFRCGASSVKGVKSFLGVFMTNEPPVASERLWDS